MHLAKNNWFWHWIHLACFAAGVLIFYVIRKNPETNDCDLVNFNPWEEYGHVVTLMLYGHRYCQLAAIPILAWILFGMVFYCMFPKRPKLIPGLDIKKLPTISFQATTKGSYPNLVRKVTEANAKTLVSSGFVNYRIEVVTATPIGGLSQLPKVTEIVVPANYQTQTGAKFKARQIQYRLDAIERDLKTREDQGTLGSHFDLGPSLVGTQTSPNLVGTQTNPNLVGTQVDQSIPWSGDFLGPDDWIVFLDEETVLAESAVIGIANHVHRNKHEYGFGLIKFTNEKASAINWFTWLCDCHRVAVDLFAEKFVLKTLNLPVCSIRGAFWLGKVSALVDTSFDHGPDSSVGEDCYHALMAASKGYTFDFIDGLMYEMSPFQLADIFQQRARWIEGVYLLMRDIGKFEWFAVWYHVSSFLQVVAFPATVVGDLLLLFYPLPLPAWWLLFLSVRDAIYVDLCVVGALVCIDWQRTPLAVGVFYLAVSPLTIPVAFLTALYGLYHLFFNAKNQNFVLINKECSNDKNKKI